MSQAHVVSFAPALMMMFVATAQVAEPRRQMHTENKAQHMTQPL